MAAISGTFSGTGQSATATVYKATYALDFGTGTVALEMQMEDAAWVAVRTFTASEAGTLDGKGRVYRFNCTAYTADIGYEIVAAY